MTMTKVVKNVNHDEMRSQMVNANEYSNNGYDEVKTTNFNYE